MKWKGRQQSTNVEDRRGGGGVGKKVGGLGLGGVVIVVIVSLIFGENPLNFLSQIEGGGQTTNTTTAPRADDELAGFVKVVLKDTEDVWTKLFNESGKRYQKPVLVLFEGSVKSACGQASSATGPFYCPGDQKLYIDLSFFDELKRLAGNKKTGDFAMAYVVAHEVAHHVQFLLGITKAVDSQRGSISKEEYNKLSVKLELQADFFAGVWAHHGQKMYNFLEEGDLQEALNCAESIGDDRLQMEARGYVVPESFTHGTSEQRRRWFSKGFQTGDPGQGDTFQTDNL